MTKSAMTEWTRSNNGSDY